MISDSDLKIQFLLGKHFNYNDICTLHSLTIEEISKIGFDKYNEYISILCITKDDIEEIFDYELEKEVEPFDFIFQNCMFGGDEIRDKIISSFELFFKEPVGVCEQGYFFIGEFTENRCITKTNFNYMIEMLRQQNCIQVKAKPKPKNEAQKERFKKRKQIRQKYKKNDDNEMNHIISAVCAKHNSYNLLNIGSLTIYQLIDQYKRIHAIDDYFITINGMMHGASSENSKIKHWSESLE